MGIQRTQVGIIGAGPAGLMLARLLMEQGISSIILEAKSREYVESRIRAGVLEEGTVELLGRANADHRLKLEAQTHAGIELSINGNRTRIDLEKFSGGKCVTVYGQTEITVDLINVHINAGGDIIFDTVDVKPSDVASDNPLITFRKNDHEYKIKCDFIAGCDGFHGISRSLIPKESLKIFERTYPYYWLGILAESAPPSSELIYASHDRGFALYSMRPPTRSRLYLQCPPGTKLESWPNERVWEELRMRLGHSDSSILSEGEVIEKSITSMRSFVVEPMQYGNLFLAGDAAHIVPPTGAKGLNLALSDVYYLSNALFEFYDTGYRRRLNEYSQTALSRVWKTQRFSWWMTSMLHKTSKTGTFDDRIRLTELEYLLSSDAALKSLAENYTGLPF
ncbi:MAG: 4-hydroxybenzoate 3-monooxygenase [Rhodospirillaceae bacterium]|nr:4-hydroxybenzoate 3-monooxygenase [Rhodospirillaceae bacterium]